MWWYWGPGFHAKGGSDAALHLWGMELSVVLLIAIVLLAICVLVGTVGAYVWFGGFSHSFSSNSADWANFGNYFGGVAGPLLTFITIIALAITILIQRNQLENERRKSLLDQHLRLLDALYRDVEVVAKRPLSRLAGGEVTLETVLDGEIRPFEVDQGQLKNRLDDALRLIAFYCEAVALYRDNVSEYFDFKAFRERGAALLNRVKPFVGILGGISAITIEFCDMHLQGVRERKSPEALKRLS